MAIKFFGLGNFLGGMSEGFSQMAKIQQEKDRLMLEAQALELRDKHLMQDADQFSRNEQLAREQMAQNLGISTRNQELAGQEISQRERIAYMQQMEGERAEGRARLERSKPTMESTLQRAFMLDLIQRNPDAPWAKPIESFLSQSAGMGAPSSVLGGTAGAMFDGNPYANFYKGGILGTLGQ